MNSQQIWKLNDLKIKRALKKARMERAFDVFKENPSATNYIPLHKELLEYQTIVTDLSEFESNVRCVERQEEKERLLDNSNFSALYWADRSG